MKSRFLINKVFFDEGTKNYGAAYFLPPAFCKSRAYYRYYRYDSSGENLITSDVDFSNYYSSINGKRCNVKVFRVNRELYNALTRSATYRAIEVEQVYK